jgi:hypothetical protein
MIVPSVAIAVRPAVRTALSVSVRVAIGDKGTMAGGVVFALLA